MGFLILLVTTVLFQNLANCQCVAGPFDLSKIPAVGKDINQTITNNGNQGLHHWYISLCNPVKSPNLPDCTTNAPGYITEYSDDLSQCETAWDTIKTTYSYDGANALVTFGELASSNRATWTMAVTIQCGPNLGPDPQGDVLATQVGFSTYNFKMTLATSVLCTNPPPNPPGPPSPPGEGGSSGGGCGGGCAFTIIFFVGAFVYVTGTMAFNFIKLGKRGTEVLPHTEFWKSFPGLLKDGVFFIVGKFRGCAGKGASTSYQNI